MNASRMNTSRLSWITLATTALLLTACGGGGDNLTSSVTEPDNTPLEPIQITSSNWNNSEAFSKSLLAPTITTEYKRNGPTTRGWMALMMKVRGVTDSKHFQIHIDMDNNPKTGFQYKNEAWSKLSGIDYIIEDGAIYQSTANDSSWSWKYLPSDYQTTQYTRIKMSGGGRSTIDPSSVNASLSRKFLDKLCNNFNIGYVGLDENWNIEVFHPKANTMLAQTVKYCAKPTTNTPPVLTEKYTNRQEDGYKEIYIPVGALARTYINKGVIATDKEDGNIGYKILKTITDPNNKIVTRIDTSKVTAPYKYYKVVYSVVDSDGNKAATTKQRFFYVKPKGAANNYPVFKYAGNNTLAPITVKVGTDPKTITPATPVITVEDFEDGKIPSAKIIIDRSRVNTAVISNNSYLTYRITDSGGATKTLHRTVKVISGKNIDGKKDDWNQFAHVIDPFNKASLFITDDAANLYIMVDAKTLGANTAVYIDHDNNKSTGYRLDEKYPSGASWKAGVDLLVENSAGYRYSGKDYQWSWAYVNHPTKRTRVVRSTNILEMAIPKSNFTNKGKGSIINLGFISLDSNWNNKNILQYDYKLKH